jgi:LPS sulfotransferase NodH/predicted negative regulator of RcsB-dependent stress response
MDRAMNLEEAKTFYDMGDLAKTEKICRAVLENDSNNAPALHLLGCVAFQAGQIASGTDLIKKAINLSPNNSSYLMDLGDLFLKSGNFSEAEKYLTDVINAEPENAVANVLKGNAISNSGRRNDAIEYWFRYVSIKWGNTQKLIDEKNHPLNSADLDYPDYQGSIKPYIICSTPRCGSTLLCDLLSQSGDLGIPHEYLTISAHGLFLMGRLGIDLTDPNLAQTYLNTIKRIRTSPNGLFGLKAHHHHLNILIDPPLLNDVFPKAKFAQILRRNRIAQAVSFAIASQTEQWDSTKKKQTEPAYDSGLLDQCLSQILNQETEWTFFFQVNNIKPHIINYEDLLEDSKSVCKKFVDFVESKTNFDFNIDTSKFSRQSNQLNLEWENRYRSERGIFPG